MSARDDILASVRARRPGANDGAEPDARLRTHPSGPVPARAEDSGDEIRQRFVAAAQKASADVEALEGLASLPRLVARLCGEQGIAPAAAVAPEPGLQDLDWDAAGVTAEYRAAVADDRLCVSQALCGVAETGTVALRSGPTSPVTLNFLPDVHVVVLDAERLVGGYEQVWARSRALGPMPRTVNWITGPSRSADIEQTIQIGAHGPLRLVIAVY